MFVSAQSDPQFNRSHSEYNFMVKSQLPTHKKKTSHFPNNFKCEECNSLFPKNKCSPTTSEKILPTQAVHVPPLLTFALRTLLMMNN